MMIKVDLLLKPSEDERCIVAKHEISSEPFMIETSCKLHLIRWILRFPTVIEWCLYDKQGRLQKQMLNRVASTLTELAPMLNRT